MTPTADLRTRLVEAMAEVLFEAELRPNDRRTWGNVPESVRLWHREQAESALDAALSYLSTHADEWRSETPVTLDGTPTHSDIRSLLAALSHPETEE